MSHARHSWEAVDPFVAVESSVDDSASDVGSARSLCSSDDEHIAEPTPGDELVGFCKVLLWSRTLNAREFCTIMYWAGKAGVAEAVPLGYNPDAASGNFARHLRATQSTLGVIGAPERLYTVRVPGHSKTQLGRTVHDVTVYAPHEIILDEIVGAGADYLVREAVYNQDLPPCYYDHPVVTQHRSEVVWPFSLYVDAVPYSHTDSVIGWWMVNEVTASRYLFCTLRKKLFCKCGCRGWCTLYTIFRLIRWSVDAMASATWPSLRHDGSPWLPRDSARAGVAGQPLKARCALLFVKGDWAEYSTTLGLASWTDAIRPCFKRNASRHSFMDASEAGPLNFPARENREGDYRAACARCERWVTISAAQHATLVGLLVYDRRADGSHGRTLLRDVPELGLLARDRLEPSPELHDVGLFELLTHFPRRVLWWRPSLETLSRHANPMFAQELGTDPSRCLVIDALHAVNLGIMHVFARHAVWYLLLSGVYGGHGNQDERLQTACLVFRHELMTWYGRRQRERPHEQLTRLSDFSLKTVGEPAKRKLKTKGAETYGLLLFLGDELERRASVLGDACSCLAQASRALERFVAIQNEAGTVMTMSETQACWDALGAHYALTASLDDFDTPKRHLVLHMLRMIPTAGNPRRYACWLDESLNRLLKASCRTISQATFDTSVLTAMRELLRGGTKRKA